MLKAAMTTEIKLPQTKIELPTVGRQHAAADDFQRHEHGAADEDDGVVQQLHHL